VILKEGGNLEIRWRSGTLNAPPSYMVPVELRPAIIECVECVTGRTVIK
jgi:hypothetical protein